MVINAFGGLASIPVYLALPQASLQMHQVLSAGMVGLVGLQAGFMTSLGPQLYPVGLRVSGYGLGISLAVAVIGGFAPVLVNILQGVDGWAQGLPTGVVSTGMGVVSGIAGAVLLYREPHISKTLARAELPPILG
jgi:hypothetical protein